MTAPAPHNETQTRWRRILACVAALSALITLATLAAGATQADAGIYELQSCPAETPLPFHGQLERYGANRVDVVQNCDRDANGWIGIYQTRKGNSFANGEGAGYRWTAPVGAAFIRSRVLGKLKGANGIAAQIYATNPDGGYLALDEESDHDGAERQLYVDFAKSPRSQLAIRLACLSKPPCSNRATDVKAFFEMRRLSFWLKDSSTPQVKLSGELFDRAKDGTPHRGNGQLKFQAKDAGGGLREAYAEINGNITELATFSCPGARNGFADRTQPCPLEETRTTSFDTSRPPFGEGTNTLRICARDYATEGTANSGCSESISIAIDNDAPAASQGLTLAGDDGWRATNSFDLSWTNSGKQATPIVAVLHRLYDANTGLPVGAQQTDTRSVTSLKGIRVPHAGHFYIEVRLRDKAGNEGPPATADLRFDDHRPGAVNLTEDLGWVGARHLPLRLQVPLPPAAGPSGVRGIVHSLRSAPPSPATDPELPDLDLADETLCPGGSCRGEEISPPQDGPGNGAETTSLDLGRLPEGRYRLDLAAVSGAWLRTDTPQSTSFEIDLTDPQTSIDGVPSGWSRTPVQVEVKARDGQSGMSPRSGEGSPPITVIEPLGEARVEQVGARAALLISQEGTHHLRYWARDLAGNANDGSRVSNGHRHDPPGEATVKIDRSAPQVAFLKPDREDPELIRAAVKDPYSGLRQGQIQLGPLSGGAADTGTTFTQLPTTLAAGTLTARLPSEQLPAGRYELRATAWDRAGNGGGWDARQGGAKVAITLPLKATPSVNLAFAGNPASHLALGRNTPAVVTGHALGPDGQPLSGAPLELVEQFDIGARVSQASTPLVTGEMGEFRVRLQPGPSRKVSARLPGNRRLTKAESAPLHLSWPAQVQMRIAPQISRNGEKVRMRGRVRGYGAQIPAAGKLVAIQFFDASRRRWRPVDLLRTDSRGRFRFSYRFRTVSSPQRFIFRATAPGEAGWPYRPARSGRNSVVVYPR